MSGFHPLQDIGVGANPIMTNTHDADAASAGGIQL
jgi:hypothetical protein